MCFQLGPSFEEEKSTKSSDSGHDKLGLKCPAQLAVKEGDTHEMEKENSVAEKANQEESNNEKLTESDTKHSASLAKLPKKNREIRSLFNIEHRNFQQHELSVCTSLRSIVEIELTVVICFSDSLSARSAKIRSTRSPVIADTS